METLLSTNVNYRPPFFNKRKITLFFVILILFLIVMATFGYLVFQRLHEANDNFQKNPTSETQEAVIGRLTQELVQGKKPDQELINIAQKRKELLLKEIPIDPQVLIKNQISEEQSNNFPGQTLDYLEKQVIIKGNLFISHTHSSADIKNYKATFHYLLSTENGRKIIYPTSEIPQFYDNNEVTINGISLEDNVVIDPSQSDSIKKAKQSSGKSDLLLVWTPI